MMSMQKPSSQPIYSFPSFQRLLTSQDFQEVYRQCRRFPNRCMVLLVKPNNCTYPRLGISIAKKNVRKAVERNRIRRIIRESFRHHQEQLGSLDIIVVIHRMAEALSNAELYQELAKQWQKLIDYYSASSTS